MLRTVNAERTLWETILPEECLGLSAELAAVDALLDDVRFFEPYRVHFDPAWGRPSIPIETYLRLMFLKFRYQLGYETLCREVADSISWQRFCRIPLGGRVPHPTTLMKITTRCGPQVVEELNETLVAKAVEARLVKTNRVRVDTTVIEADIAYPTDSGLLTKAVGRISRLVKRIQARGAAARTEMVDNVAEARRHAHSIGVWLRRRTGEAKDEVLRITEELADLAETAVGDARRVIANARRHLTRHPETPKAGQLRRIINDLHVLSERTNQVVAQTRIRVAGDTPDGATRIVSLHEPDARPIRKGRLKRPVEFGYKAQVVDNEDGIVLDHSVEVGNPPDRDQIIPAIKRVTERTGRAPNAVTADRGYGMARNDRDLEALGVTTVAIPRPGRPPPARLARQQDPDFTELVRWRTGCEGRISSLKRDYGWRRTRLRGISGARTWSGHGILTHNLTKIARLQT